MRKSTVSLSIALLASVASAVGFWQALRVERARNAELAAQLERQGVELQRVTEVAASAVRESPAAPAASSAAPNMVAAVAAPASPSTVATGSQEDWEAAQRRLLRDPKYREALREQERLKLAPRRANFIRLLGFTPEQADAAIDLGIEQQLGWREQNSSQDRSPEALKAARARYEAEEREHQDKLRALLGEEKRARLQGYMESRESRMQVEDLRSDLNEANALRDDQIEPLIAALHAERAQAQAELREYRSSLNWEGVNNETWRLYGERKTELMKAMNSRMLSSASSLLTQSQLNALREQLRQELAQHEAQLRMSRIQTKLDQTSQPATTSN
jgi:hypothetical protein